MTIEMVSLVATPGCVSAVLSSSNIQRNPLVKASPLPSTTLTVMASAPRPESSTTNSDTSKR